jgi:hypothetical protein
MRGPGVGATCQCTAGGAPRTWTSQAHDIPGALQDRRGMNAASSPFRQNGVSSRAGTDRSGFRRQIDGIQLLAGLKIRTRDEDYFYFYFACSRAG